VATVTFLMSAFITFGMCKTFNITCISSFPPLSQSKQDEEKEKKELKIKKKNKSQNQSSSSSSLSSGELIMLTLFLLISFEFILFFICQVALSFNDLLLGRRVVDFLCGLYFGFGLKICGMASPTNVLAFFDTSDNLSHWDPSLMLVMVGAIGVARLLYSLNGGEAPSQPPFLTESYKIASYESTFNVDDKLIVGSMIFGVGWSMMGYCPGPALLSLTLRSAPGEILTNVIYSASMFIGWALYYRVFK
jgi:uncharacterized protein